MRDRGEGRIRASAAIAIAAGVLGCSSPESADRDPAPEEVGRTSMPEERKVMMDSMPTGIPEDSMERQMRRAFQEAGP